MFFCVIGLAVVHVQVVDVLVLRVLDDEFIRVVGEIVHRKSSCLSVNLLFILASLRLSEFMVVIVNQDTEHEGKLIKVTSIDFPTK